MYLSISASLSWCFHFHQTNAWVFFCHRWANRVSVLCVWFPWLDSETKLPSRGPSRETGSWHTHANKTHSFCSQTHREPVKRLDNCAPVVLYTTDRMWVWSSVELVQSDCFSFSDRPILIFYNRYRYQISVRLCTDKWYAEPIFIYYYKVHK